MLRPPLYWGLLAEPSAILFFVCNLRCEGIRATGIFLSVLALVNLNCFSYKLWELPGVDVC